ncbi:MAG: hypothetical protein ACI8W8_004103, partial [Rhodothermales bacterium]
MSESSKEAELRAEIDAEINRLLEDKKPEPEYDDYEEEVEYEEEEAPEPEPEPVRKKRGTKRSELVNAAKKKKAKHRQAAPAKVFDDPVTSVAKLAAYKKRIVQEIGKVVI